MVTKITSRPTPRRRRSKDLGRLVVQEGRSLDFFLRQYFRRGDGVSPAAKTSPSRPARAASFMAASVFPVRKRPHIAGR